MGFELEKAHHDISLAKHINIGKLIRRESLGAMVVSLFPRGAVGSCEEFPIET